jgi:hypothetical protein
MTPDAVIDELGGTSTLAALLQVDDSTVSTWRRRGIPPGRWAEVVKVAKRRRCAKITFEALAALHEGARA